MMQQMLWSKNQFEKSEIERRKVRNGDDNERSSGKQIQAEFPGLTIYESNPTSHSFYFTDE